MLAILFGAKVESRAQKRQSTLIKDLKIEIRTVFQNVTRRSTSVLLYWSPSINKALYEYCVTTSHKRVGATRQCKCVRGGKTSKETFIDFSVIFCFSFMLSFATRHPPKDCFYVFHIFMRSSLLSSSRAALLVVVRRKINAKLLIREFLHQITVKKVAASAVGIECRGVVT